MTTATRTKTVRSPGGAPGTKARRETALQQARREHDEKLMADGARVRKEERLGGFAPCAIAPMHLSPRDAATWNRGYEAELKLGGGLVK